MKVPIKINGIDTEVEEGQRLLLILNEKGIKVPSLCFHHALTPAASCKLCVVEIKEGDAPPRTRLSCAMKVKAGLEVTTESAMIHQMRNTAIGNLLKQAPHAEAIHKIGLDFGLSTGAIPDGCIRCRMCVRVCAEIIGAKALTFVREGGRSYVKPAENNACIGCLTCTNLCPTGAIHYKDKGNVRTILIRYDVVGRHTLERCSICGRLFATSKFLEHVRHREENHPDEKEKHLHCPTCAKLYYRKNLHIAEPKLAKTFGSLPLK
ncbi:MAG: 2Fe-2S iron-sulfur cluster-binding protein [Deltaproteobacteria bacterium]